MKELARTTPPDQMAIKPTFTESKAMADLTRTDSGRRRHILEQIGSSGSHVQKPLERLFRLNRSATTSDLNEEEIAHKRLEIPSMRETIPQACLEIASKHSSSSRRYTKITIDPIIYKIKNPSTLQVNFEKSEAEGNAFQADVEKSKEKGKSYNWLSRKLQSNADLVQKDIEPTLSLVRRGS